MLDSSHKLYKSLPQKNINTYNLRRPHHFKAYNARTNRFKNSFFSTMVKFFLRVFVIVLVFRYTYSIVNFCAIQSSYLFVKEICQL